MRLSCSLPFSRYSKLFVEIRQLRPTPPAFGALFGVTLFEFREDFWHQKTRVLELLCGVVCVILYLAVLVELRLVTDTQTQSHNIYRTGHSSRVKNGHVK